MPHPPQVELRSHHGRPTIFINGEAHAMPTYSPIGWREDKFKTSVPWFTDIGMGLYFVSYPRPIGADQWGEQLFWKGNDISDNPLWDYRFGIEEQIQFILERDPEAYFIVRNGGFHCPSWCEANPQELFVDRHGQRGKHPSMASQHWIDRVAEHGVKIAQWCHRQAWSDRVIGHWYGWELEGTPAHTFSHELFDYSEVMQDRFRSFLKHQYGSDAALREAWQSEHIRLADDLVPTSQLHGSMDDIQKLHLWQNPKDNRALIDYFSCLKECFHSAFKHVARDVKASLGSRLLLTDCLKTTMQGWSNLGFFGAQFDPAPISYDTLASSGHMGISELLESSDFDGIITPHDYQNRGVGGTFEPEGAVDSCALRNKFFFAEGDVRTFNDDIEKGAYGTARTPTEFKAINWRNFAAAHTRGFNYYWMDIVGDWFAHPELQKAIRETVAVQKQAIHWPRQTPPCIAMIIDDHAALETNGSGQAYNDLVMEEWKRGLAHCGVPYRIYLLEDLALENFPEHHLFYFPNLFRVTDEKLQLLQRRVFKNGNVVLWGPGSGISDGQSLSPEHASKLTGFTFDMVPVNHPRLVSIENFDHPLTHNLDSDSHYGTQVAMGPILHPKDGTRLALAHTKMGRNEAGLSVKSFGHGARSQVQDPQKLGSGDWASVFSFACPLPTQLWRNLARFSGTHVYCESNDVISADTSLVSLHTRKSGAKTISLPENCRVTDLNDGQLISQNTRDIHFEAQAPETRIFRLEALPKA